MTGLNMIDKLSQVKTPLLFWSGPGCGKSVILSQYVLGRNGAFAVLYTARVDPMTLAGLPALASQGGVEMQPWEWVKKLNEAAEGSRLAVLFLDEINGGDSQQLAAVQSLAAERRIGEVRLHPDVRIWAAANPTAVSTGGCELPPPILNRFTHIRWFEEGPYAPAPAYPFLVSRRQWINWMREQGGSYALVAMAVESLGLPAAEAPDSERPFASPRSWAMLAEVLDQVGGAESPLAEGLALGAVGPVGTKAVLWLRELSLPSADQLLTGVPIPAAPDKAAACVEVVSVYAKHDIHIDPRAAIGLIGRFLDQHPGLAVVLASRLARHILAADYEPTSHEIDILDRVGGVR